MSQTRVGDEELEINSSPDRERRPSQRWQRLARGLRRAWSPAYTLASTNLRLATTFVYILLAIVAYTGAYLLRFESASLG